MASKLNKKNSNKTRIIHKQAPFNESDYEFSDRFVPFDGNPLNAHTIAEMMECLAKGKAEIEARVLTSDGGFKRYHNAKSFMEAVKRNDKNSAKLMESWDSFSNWSDGNNIGSPYGQEPIPMVGGPFYKQLYYYDYIRMHNLSFYAYHHDPMARLIVNTIIEFTLGRGFRVDIEDKTELAIWRAFEEANDLQGLMHQVARELSIYGEEMLWWLPNGATKIGYQDRPGQEPQRGIIPRVRTMDPSSVWDIITFPEDITRVLGYQVVSPCLHGDTKIALLSGEDETIGELAKKWEETKVPVPIYSFDLELKRVIPAYAHTIVNTGKKRCVKVILDSGDEVIASFDHPFLTRSGEYVWAENLEEGQSLMPLYRDVSKNGYERVYQPELKTTQYTHRMVAENFWEVDDGFVVHHEDHDKRNNNPENLKIVSDSEHRSEHAKSFWKDPAYIQKVNEARNAAMQSESYRAQMSLLKKGNTLTEEQLSRRVASWHETVKTSDRFKLAMEEKTKLFKSEKIRKANSDRKKAQWADPVYAENQKKKLREAWVKRKEKMGNNHKVMAVIEAGEHEVYDLTVEGTHNFALSCGVFTHNTQYQTYTTMDAGSPVPGSKFIYQQIPASQIDHIKVNCVSNEKRGRSDLFPVLGYLKRLRDAVNYSIIALQKQSAWCIDTSIDGESEAIDSYVDDLNAQLAMPNPGSEFVHSNKVTRTYLSSATGKGGGSDSFEWCLSMIAAGTGIPVSYFGTHLSGGQTRASAMVSTEPVAKKFELRQVMYERIIRSMINRLGIKSAVEITFPELIIQDRSSKLKDLALSETQGWISKSRAAEIAAKELHITDFEFNKEMEDISAEKSTEPGILSPLTAPPAVDGGQEPKSKVTSQDRKGLADAERAGNA